jgi:hypothetical protein
MKGKPTVSKEFQALKNTIEKQLVNKLCNKPAHLLGKPVISHAQPAAAAVAATETASAGAVAPGSKKLGQLGSLDSLGNNLNSSEQSSQMSSFSTSSLEEHKLAKQVKRLAPVAASNANVSQETATLPTRPKPKLIDQEFKNELEKLFSSSSPSRASAANRALSSSRLNTTTTTTPTTPVKDAVIKINTLDTRTNQSTVAAVADSMAQRRFHKSSDQIVTCSSPTSPTNEVVAGVSDSFEKKKMILDSLMQSRLARMNETGMSGPSLRPPPIVAASASANAAAAMITTTVTTTIQQTSSVITTSTPPLPPPMPPPPPPPMPPLPSSFTVPHQMTRKHLLENCFQDNFVLRRINFF